MTTALLAATTEPINWTLIAVLGGATLYVAIIRPAMKKKDPLAKKKQSPMAANRLAAQRDTERVMQNLLVELAEMSRQISAQLDTRSQKLELLMQQADERIATLKQLQGDRPPPMFSRPEPVAEVFTPRESFAPRELELVPQNATEDARHQEIYRMSDMGRGAGDIARELGRPRGEVELILALRPRA